MFTVSSDVPSNTLLADAGPDCKASTVTTAAAAAAA